MMLFSIPSRCVLRIFIEPFRNLLGLIISFAAVQTQTPPPHRLDPMTNTTSGCVINDASDEDDDTNVHTGTSHFHVFERSFVWIERDPIRDPTAMAWGLLPICKYFDRR